MSLPKILLHVPKLNIVTSRSIFGKPSHKMYVNRVYNLNNLKFIDYNNETKTMTLNYLDGTSYKLSDSTDDNGVQKAFQEISRNLFTNDSTKIVTL
jgi:hypothetical protein